jgi:hypothetical protein
MIQPAISTRGFGRPGGNCQNLHRFPISLSKNSTTGHYPLFLWDSNYFPLRKQRAKKVTMRIMNVTLLREEAAVEAA